ncbi:MAG TPA: hypothetical protein VKQ29_17015 [Aliidongia sp.]|nr:hypothetical protein [Aliidongia sp.]
MSFKPNYNQQRAERNRLKQAKKEEKLKRKQEAVAERRSGEGAVAGDDESDDQAEPSA